MLAIIPAEGGSIIEAAKPVFAERESSKYDGAVIVRGAVNPVAETLNERMPAAAEGEPAQDVIVPLSVPAVMDAGGFTMLTGMLRVMLAAPVLPIVISPP